MRKLAQVLAADVNKRRGWCNLSKRNAACAHGMACRTCIYPQLHLVQGEQRSKQMDFVHRRILFTNRCLDSSQ